MQQWILARPEMREFLGGRVMVPYPEPWMDRVDAMKTLPGLDRHVGAALPRPGDLRRADPAVDPLRRLEQRINASSTPGANWARYWRPEVQGYIHAYRAATGVDLANQPDATMPSVLLQQRLPARHAPRRTPLVPTGVRPRKRHASRDGHERRDA